MIKRSFISASIAAAVLAFSPLASAEKVTVSGSTTVQKRILEPASKAITAATGISVKVLGTGSGKGFKDMKAGKVPASVASSPMSSLLNKNKLTDDGTFQEHVIIRDVIVPIVHKSNPVSELTWAQLADIHTGKINNWKDVGGPDQKIIVVTSHKGSATRAVFQKQVMKKAGYLKSKREVKSTRQEVGRVSKFKGGIGAVSEAFVRLNPGKVKVLKTKEISRPLSFITKGDPNPTVAKLLAYLKSDAAKKHFK